MYVRREIKLGSGATVEVVFVDTEHPSDIKYFDDVFRSLTKQYQVVLFTEEPITKEKE